MSLMTRGWNNLFIKSTLIVAMMILLVVGIITVLETRDKREMVVQALSARAVDVTNLLSLQMAGSIQFGNEVAVADIAGNVIEAARPDAMGVVVMNAKGVILYETADSGIANDAEMAMAQRALETGERIISEDRLTVA
eukprot:CAMPEP_0184428192 /NCGR_PEP_ID=MMETSP0738-20130409/202368_1 /TAXON_ID=385413 /ORGANISM="Thalassiosira miniscula, Strain CCMP1093" /LENGTH=137 /DNA_ID=CAMNT_0026792015 /DNA_START=148 /DNA_END=557 /DNA_ORIENTATION=-